MQERPKSAIVRNLANIVSILGILPICILFREQGYQYLVPLIVFNNIMDDLDGVLAGTLNIKSDVGALLDNLCDAIAHTVFVMVVGMHFAQKMEHAFTGGICLAASLLATVAIIARIVIRLEPVTVAGTGSPTNELIRHILFAVVTAQYFQFDPVPLLIVLFGVHAVTMLVPFRMPYLIRSRARSAVTIGLVNVALVVAWLVPYSAPVIGTAFIGTYLCSFVVGGIGAFSADTKTTQ